MKKPVKEALKIISLVYLAVFITLLVQSYFTDKLVFFSTMILVLETIQIATGILLVIGGYHVLSKRYKWNIDKFIYQNTIQISITIILCFIMWYSGDNIIKVTIFGIGALVISNYLDWWHEIWKEK